MEHLEKIAINSLLQYELELISFDPDFQNFYLKMFGNILEPNEQKARLVGAIEALEILLFDFSRFQGKFDDVEWEEINLELNKRKLRYLENEFTLCDFELENLIPLLNLKIVEKIIKLEK
jgi:hypothetical protein